MLCVRATLATALAFSLPLFLTAQAPPAQEAPVNEPPPAASATQPTPSAQPLTPQQLDDPVAPIALYPDTLLSEILAASTYPLEIVEAEQWLQQHQNLTGQALMDAAQQQNWDPSVQALVAFPNVLSLLNQDVNWTTALGNAFLAQRADLMAAVQRLRAKAEADGRLHSTPELNVTTVNQNGQSIISIEPASPQIVYVPEYNPDYIWGPPVYGDYPPLYYPPVDTGIAFLPGVNLGLYFGGAWGLYGGFGWGWSPNWFAGNIVVNPHFFHRFGFRGYLPGPHDFWVHNPEHRFGVPYPNRDLANRFGRERFFGGAHGAVPAFGRGFEAPLGGGEFRAQIPRAPAERFGTPGFEHQNFGGNHSAFGGIRGGPEARIQSDRGFEGMAHAGFARPGGFAGGHAGRIGTPATGGLRGGRR